MRKITKENLKELAKVMPTLKKRNHAADKGLPIIIKKKENLFIAIIKKSKSIFNSLFWAILTLLSVYSCSKESDLDSLSDYSHIIKKYRMTDVTNNESLSTADTLTALSPSELDKILSTFLKTKISIKSTHEYNLYRSRVVVISGSNQDCTAEVHLDIDNTEVIDSKVYYTGIMSIFLVYTHTSANVERGWNRIDFTVKGEVVVKIIWQGIELKRVPVTIKGYYYLDSGNGELTFY